MPRLGRGALRGTAVAHAGAGGAARRRRRDRRRARPGDPQGRLRAHPFAHRTPYRVEAPFQLAIAGRVVRGRIDAVYRTDDGDGTAYEIVDWKTGRTGDPLQLALYRLAWAEQQGVRPEAVRAAFLYVRTGEVVRPEGLPDRAALERLLRGAPSAEEPADEDAGAGR
ncbi:PD-(D/E)XK nuclease family protein [Streptomyces chiangmaiensis]